MTELKGEIDNISTKTKGIQIGGTWYSCSDAAAKFLERLHKGDKVSLNLDENKKVTFVKVEEAATQVSAPDTESEKGAYFRDKEKHSVKAMALSYAKDLCVGDKIEKDAIIDVAQKFFEWLYS
jgi:hypothetical protein